MSNDASQNNGKTNPTTDIADVGDVLLAELQAIKDRRTAAGNQPSTSAASLTHKPKSSSQEKIEEYQKEVKNLSVSALCLSGGGIRSAAFALGVLQGLADRGILSKFDYLSTVSGGGYVGSMLTAWVQRATGGYQSVEKELKSGAAAGAKVSPLQHLRRYTSYLTPSSGLLTTDTLTLVALYVRNLLLNWLVIIPAMLAIIITMKLFAQLYLIIPPGLTAVAWSGGLGIAFVGAAVLDSIQQRPGWGDNSSGRGRFISLEMIPILLGGICLNLAILKFDPLTNSSVDPWLSVILIAGSVFLISAVLALAFSSPKLDTETSTKENIRSVWAVWAILIIAGFSIAGMVTGYLLVELVGLASSLKGLTVPAWAAPFMATPFIVICLGPPLFIAAVFAGELLYCGLTSNVRWGDAEREWLARAAGYHGRAAAIWAIMTLLIFGGSELIFYSYNQAKSSTVSALLLTGGGTGLVTSLIGKASSTAAVLKKGYFSIKDISLRLVLAVAVPLFFAVLVAVLSALTDLAVNGDFIGFDRPLECKIGKYLWAALAASVVIAVAGSILINTNRFSLHGIYRNRLIRAFLGASKVDRKPNAFTDLNQWDNLDLIDIWPAKAGPAGGSPHLHVVNMALNIVATRELAWRERKALSFTATPLAIGCGDLQDPKDPPAADLRRARGYYRSANEYGGPMSLGTAMTISGAAASPNMGYHSSPMLSFLLTFFNVRLGAWMGNPGPAGNLTYKRRGPLFSAWPMFQEMVGQTDANKGHVYLSDGGHFENLGLYEMVRRRCQLIVVSDAGCDPNCEFEDLGNALRRISIDLDAEIKFRSLKIKPRAKRPTAGTYCAIADIEYQEGSKGLLLYLKPDYQGIEPAPVRSYAAKSKSFPHEATTDQWFGESQFEAYRTLGRYIVGSIDRSSNAIYADIKSFIEAVAKVTPP